jgi:hypothetical protein
VSGALVTEHAKRMRRIILSSVASLSTIFFHISSQTAQFSKKKMLLNKKLKQFSLKLLSETFLFLRITDRDYIYTGLHVKQPFVLSRFNETRICSTDFRKILISNFMKIRPWEPSCSMRTDRQTDMTKLVAF